MRKTVLVLGLVLFTTSLFAADPAGEARQAEIAFAKAFADRDAAAFFSFIPEDAHFLSAKRTLSGKAEVREVWSKFLEGPKAPFSWTPERVVANAAGDLALSTGPVYDPDGTLIGNYSSVWQKQADGSWKVVFDGPGSEPPCPPAGK